MPNPVHIHIAEPCHENWQQMTPNEQGRHCMSCQKTVIDFSLMSDQEILHYISRASSSICGRFNNDQLNKTYAEKEVKRAFSFRYAWNVVVATFLLTGNKAMAQGEVVVKKKEPVSQYDKTNYKREELVLGGISAMIVLDRKISGEVIDDNTGMPVTYASVRVKGVKTGVSADESGRFDFIAPGTKGKLTLVVSAVGYATNEYEVPVNNRKLYKIMLVPAPEELKPVEVIGYPGKVVGKIAVRQPEIKKDTLCLSGVEGRTAGGLSITRKITTIEKIKREVNEWLPTKKDVRIYPNPLVPGNQVNINLSLEKAGEYKLDLMDASGRLVYVQALQVVQKGQVVNVPTQSSWSRGVYWVRISAAHDKKVYQAKVLLQ